MKRSLCALLGALSVAAATSWGGGTVCKRVAELRVPPELLQWQRTPWLLDLSEAVRTARAEKRPLLVWVTEDDPLERC